MIEVSVIVPTRCEAANLPELARRVALALHDVRYELLVVDDNSPDDTRAVCQRLAQEHPLRLIVRERPSDGLSGAVLEGFRTAHGEVAVVMDADLQHPPESLPALLAPLRNGSADFVLGSRYVPGGSTGETFTRFRKLNSNLATLLARPFSRGVRDPMSGFFALHTARVREARFLSPLGYKIGLELLCKTGVSRVREVPIHFAARHAGLSKLTLREQFRYLEHLSRLYDFSFPRASPVLKFLIVLLIGGGVALALWQVSGSVVAGYAGHVAATALFHARYIRTQRAFLRTRRPWTEFLIIAAAELVAVALVSWWGATRLRAGTGLEHFAISFFAGTVVRYVLRKEFMHDIRGLRHEARVEE